MAKIREMDQAAWEDWVATRPAAVQELCRKLPPDRLYMNKPTQQRGTIYSYSEDGTVTVNFTGEHNLLMFDKQVFGIKPEDLEECELPTEDELRGTMLTERTDIDAYIDAVRPAVLAARAGDEGGS